MSTYYLNRPPNALEGRIAVVPGGSNDLELIYASNAFSMILMASLFADSVMSIYGFMDL